jgi:hypothetical protein
MFGLSQKERYESKVEVCLIALLADAWRTEADQVIPLLKKKYSEHWDGVLQEGIELRNSPETSALTITVNFYTDCITNLTTPKVILKIRQAIINDEMIVPNDLLFRMKVTFALASQWASKEISKDKLINSIRDIHRSIFNDDDKLFKNTLGYFLGATAAFSITDENVNRTGT